MTTLDAIIVLAGVILLFGLASVLYHFDMFKYPHKWEDELQNHYISKILQNNKKSNTEEEVNHDSGKRSD